MAWLAGHSGAHRLRPRRPRLAADAGHPRARTRRDPASRALLLSGTAAPRRHDRALARSTTHPPGRRRTTRVRRAPRSCARWDRGPGDRHQSRRGLRQRQALAARTLRRSGAAVGWHDRGRRVLIFGSATSANCASGRRSRSGSGIDAPTSRARPRSRNSSIWPPPAACFSPTTPAPCTSPRRWACPPSPSSAPPTIRHRADRPARARGPRARRVQPLPAARVPDRPPLHDAREVAALRRRPSLLTCAEKRMDTRTKILSRSGAPRGCTVVTGTFDVLLPATSATWPSIRAKHPERPLLVRGPAARRTSCWPSAPAPNWPPRYAW